MKKLLKPRKDSKIKFFLPPFEIFLVYTLVPLLSIQRYYFKLKMNSTDSSFLVYTLFLMSPHVIKNLSQKFHVAYDISRMSSLQLFLFDSNFSYFCTFMSRCQTSFKTRCATQCIIGSFHMALHLLVQNN